MSILVLNAGSSTLKFAVFDDNANDELAAGSVDWAGGSAPANLVFRLSGGEQRRTLDAADHRAAVGHIIELLRTAALN